MESRFHACHEGQLDLFSIGSSICAEIPTRAHLGSIFQHYRFLRWYLCQFGYEEEASCSSPQEISGRKRAKTRRLPRSTKILVEISNSKLMRLEFPSCLFVHGETRLLDFGRTKVIHNL